jgi:hypothetical protein
MSKKNKKQQPLKPAPTTTQSSLSFSLSKWFKKVLSTHPSTLIITVIFIGYALFLFGGGLFTLTTEDILPSLFYNNRFYFLYPDVSNQFVSDTVVSMMLYLMGFVGLLSIYQSTKSANKPRNAYMLMVIGVSLVLLSYVFLEGAISFKQAGFS